MPKIHPLSIVDPKARLSDDVVIGPFCIVGPDVEIDSGTVLISHVNVLGMTCIGKRNKIYPNACVGCEPQDKKYKGEKTRLTVGDDNVIREHVTISIGTIQDHGVTIVGSRNLFMANAHVAHDCVIGNDVILANNVAVAGHCHIDDFAIIGGQAGLHQFSRIGTHAMVGGASAIVMDVPPYIICNGNPAEPHGLNVVGLKRAGYTLEKLNVLKAAYKVIYRDGFTVAEASAELAALKDSAPSLATEIDALIGFINASKRGIIRPRG